MSGRGSEEGDGLHDTPRSVKLAPFVSQVRERVMLAAQNRYDVDRRTGTRLLGGGGGRRQFTTVNPVRSSVDTPDSPLVSPMTDLSQLLQDEDPPPREKLGSAKTSSRSPAGGDEVSAFVLTPGDAATSALGPGITPQTHGVRPFVLDDSVLGESPVSEAVSIWPADEADDEDDGGSKASVQTTLSEEARRLGVDFMSP
jgi:hypothetical protein